MSVLQWQDTARFISEASAKVYNTYLSGESSRVALSFALTLLINIIDMMDNKGEAIDEAIRTLEGYEDQIREET